MLQSNQDIFRFDASPSKVLQADGGRIAEEMKWQRRPEEMPHD